MKEVSLYLFLSLFLLAGSSYSQDQLFKYEASGDFPFGKKNPAAPEQLADFDKMIGECDCLSQTRNPDGTWQDSVKMLWRFKYIMNGMAVQDETLKEDGKNSGSIRMFNSDSSSWYVHYYSTAIASPKLQTWKGGKVNNNIILSMPQKAPNGMEGVSRLTFFDISKNGFKWIGEWVKEDANIVHAFWKIDCSKRMKN